MLSMPVGILHVWLYEYTYILLIITIHLLGDVASITLAVLCSLSSVS